ncbi:BglG family transcription antiterminator [Anaerotignum lactatifermentans]|uniref:Phosphoenolpyruvate-dependent sugar phosphotransferase system, EIIA 2 n=1 Tax=Anaerotignum lactatifermentans DSM 14214 TaxID=1121323 RepID=A0A1M6VIK5_9FIRM|nr:PRD domain-containing protein [Anaerotignum lactatifermentans]SHK81289.1 Phosphoenolpyruvate-dependent sugar phosphotransferase system, EIIA 2 [[Clostridium] lactatifermentans DSM 14214] [Anaerotignum lactatifermentans DSM 14214]
MDNSLLAVRDINHKYIVVEREMGISLSQNEQLLTDLTEHITAVSSRLRLHVKVRNAQLETIKENYGEIYRATEKGCQLLRHAVGVAEVPEAEIAFIAMYICAAVEDQQSQQGKIPVVVVCPTGLGTSKMLAVQLTKEFHNLEVREIISAFRIDIQKLQREGIRLLISTVHLDIDFPYVCVNPILLEQDKILLRNELRLLPTQQAVVPQKKPAASLSKDGLVFMTRLGEEILYLLDHVQLLVLPYAQDKQELLYVASGMFTETKEARELIADSLAKREQISSTYIRDFQMMLLHCKTGGVKHCCFGYIRLKRPLFQSEGVIEGAIVMLVPKEGDSLEAGLMSEISSGLLEDEAFFSAVQKKGRISIIESLEKRLMQYYQKTITTRMEGS